jgi:hypothetical protein
MLWVIARITTCGASEFPSTLAVLCTKPWLGEGVDNLGSESIS